MRVAVIGATGSTGSLVVDKLIANGHHVVAIARSPVPSRPPANRFSTRTGDPAGPAFLRDAIADCDAVISCIGQCRASKSLFGKRISPPDIMRRVTGATLVAIGDAPTHYVYLSAFGVGDDMRRHSPVFRIILRLSSIRDAYLDHAEAEAEIRQSHARWTIIRPVGLTDANEERQLIDKGDRWSSFETTTKASVAAFLVRCVENHGPLSTTMTIGEASR